MTQDDYEAPDGWGEGKWRLSGRSEVAGWLLLPPHVDDVDSWAADQVAELRCAWGEQWQEKDDATAGALVRAGFASRPDQAALAFQLWPVPATLVAHVHASFGAAPDGFDLSAIDGGSLYDATGLGQGIQVARRVRDEESGLDLVGLDILFVFPQGAAVIATFEPTIPELFAMLVGQFHAFVQTLVFVEPSGETLRAVAPASVLDAAPDATWADTVPTR